MADTAPAGAGWDTGRTLPKILSVDDHIVEPPHLWETWLPSKWQDRAPRVVRKKIEKMTYVSGTKYEANPARHRAGISRCRKKAQASSAKCRHVPTNRSDAARVCSIPRSS